MNVFAFLLALNLIGPGDGAISGMVLDGNRQPVTATKVTLRQDGKALETAETDRKGVFHFSIPAGDYVVQINSVSKQVQVNDDEISKLEILLDQPQFFDEPQFTVAGVTDNTYRGGHGSDSVLRSSEALSKATASLSDVHSEADPHHSNAETAEREGRYIEAVREFQKAAEINPSERNLFDWGTELLSHLAPAAAAEIFDKGSQLFPNSLRMLLGLASAYYMAGDYGKAATEFFQAVDSHQHDPAPYAFLNNVQAKEIRQSAEYDQKFARYLKLHPDNALANYYYAVTVWEHWRGRDALPLLQKAVEIDPHLASAYLELGKVYEDDAQYANAIAALQTVIRQNPDLAEAHFRLAEVYRISGNRKEAVQELAIFRRLDQESSDKLEKQRREVRQFVIDLKKAKS